MFDRLFGRNRKLQKTDNITEQQTRLLMAVEMIPFERWDIEETNCPDIWVEKSANNHDQMKYKLVCDLGGCCVEVYRDPQSCLWIIDVDNDKIDFGNDQGIQKLWQEVFGFVTLDWRDQRCAIAAQKIENLLR